jgi:hypothetical protein
MLSPAQQAAREGKITASFLPALMAGDDDEIFQEWLRLIGDPSYVPKDLSDDWPPSWGSYGEPFILDWHQRKTKQAITRRGEFIPHPVKPYVGCTLDGYRAFDDTVLDAKVCSAWNPIEEISAYYAPQLICQRACVQCAHAALLLVHGSAEPHEYPLAVDAEYEAKVWQRVDQFWDCVRNLMQPVTFPRIVPPEQWRTVDLDTAEAFIEFNWATNMQALLATWNTHKDSADAHKAATDEIKKLLPDDIGTLTCQGIVVKRNRANAVSIKRR